MADSWSGATVHGALQGSRQSGTALPQSSQPSETGGGATSACEGWAPATACLTAYQHTECWLHCAAEPECTQHGGLAAVEMQIPCRL